MPTTRNNQIRIARYRNTRYWGVWLNDQLIVVTVYKRGANSVATLLKNLSR